MTGGLLSGNSIKYLKAGYFLLLASMFACEKNDISKVKALTKKEEVSYDVADSPRITYSENGWKRAVMTAPEMKKYNQANNALEFNKGINVVFYDNGKQTATLVADYAYNDEQTKITKMRGHVKMVNYRKETLLAEEIEWDIRNKRIKAPGWIKIKNKEEMIVGEGLESDEEFKNYTIKRVKGNFNVYENEGFR